MAGWRNTKIQKQTGYIIMNKILFIFTVIFATTQGCIAAIPIDNRVPESDVNNMGYMDKGNCKLRYDIKTDEDDWVLVPGRNTWNSGYSQGYITHGGACSDIGSSNDVVCVAGTATYDNRPYNNTCFNADRGWLGSVGPGNDNWRPQGNVPDCPVRKNSWTKPGQSKTAVFVTEDDKIIVTQNKKRPVRSLHGANAFSAYNVKCVAYVCVDNENHITYGDENGECITAGTTDSNTHMESIAPYLKALDASCNK